jgi:hypothetical protein
MPYRISAKPSFFSFSKRNPLKTLYWKFLIFTKGTFIERFNRCKKCNTPIPKVFRPYIVDPHAIAHLAFCDEIKAKKTYKQISNAVEIFATNIILASLPNPKKGMPPHTDPPIKLKE